VAEGAAFVAVGDGRAVAVALATRWTSTPPFDPSLEELEQALRSTAARPARTKQTVAARRLPRRLPGETDSGELKWLKAITLSFDEGAPACRLAGISTHRRVHLTPALLYTVTGGAPS